jgi:hypothetical protein
MRFLATDESEWWLGFVYIISLLPLKVTLFFSLITLSFTSVNTSLEMRQKEENLTENNTTLLDSEIHIKQLFSEENSSLFMNSILYCRKGRRQKRR